VVDSTLQSDDRALSPVVGVALLIAIVVAIAAVSAGLILGLAEPNDPAPAAAFDVESADAAGEMVIRHDGGDTIDGDRLRIEGVTDADADAFAGRRVATGTTATVAPTDDEIELVWASDERDNSAIVARLDAVVSAPFTARGAYQLLSERSEQAAPADGSHGLLFRIENPGDERATISGITLDVPDNDTVSHAHNTGSTRPGRCDGPDDPTRFCSLVQVTNPTGATHGYVAGASAGSLPYTVGTVPGDSTDESDWIAPTLGGGETASLSVYRFQTGPDVNADAAADMAGQTVEITVAFDTGQRVVIRRSLPGGQPEPEPEILEPGDRDFGSGDAVAGDVSAIDGDVDADGTAAIDGDIRAGGDVDLAENATIGGGVIGSDVSLDTGVSVGGGIVGSDVDISGNATVGGPIVGDSDVDVDGDTTVSGPLEGEDISVGGTATVGGSIDAAGDVDVTNDATLDGDIAAGGGVDIDSSSLSTVDSIDADEDVSLDTPGLRIDGDVHSAGSTVAFDADNISVTGGVTAGSIDCNGGNVTVAGQSCSAYTD
jgi:flagellin-like protein